MTSGGLEGDKFHPVDFQFTDQRGGPSSDGTPDPAILDLLTYLRGQVVDIGSGDGRYTRHMLDQGLHVVAADKNKKALATLRDYRTPDGAESKLDVVKIDAFQGLPFADDVFDGAVSTAIQHLRPPEDIRASVVETGRVLRSGGLYVVDLSTDVRRFGADGRERRGEHETGYSYKQGRRVMETALRGVFDIQTANVSRMELDLQTVEGPVHLTTRKINVLARKI